MALLKDETQTVFDIKQIQRGDCIRVKRKGDTTARNGFVVKVSPERLMILYCNIQNHANSFLEIYAADVSLGVWSIDWTSDFQTVNHEPENDTQNQELMDSTSANDSPVDDEI